MSESTQSSTERSPFTKPGFIISAALVVALLAAVVVIFFLPKDRQHRPARPGLIGGQHLLGAVHGSRRGGKSICGLPSSTDTALGAAPKTKWELVGKMAAPTDPKTFGPGRDGRRRLPVLLRSLTNRRALRGRQPCRPWLVQITANEYQARRQAHGPRSRARRS